MARGAGVTGRLAGRYELGAPLGSGGTAVVVRALDLATGQEVAIKRLRPEFAGQPPLCRRFLREGELARRLDHPNILRVLDIGQEAGTPFLVFELASGLTLRQRLETAGRLDARGARGVLTALTHALDHAHSAGIVHRDLKPENVFVDGYKVKLGDFGNARVVSLASVTGTSLTWGTPEYVAPELFARGRADPRSDFYALGVMLHELLTGRLPWPRAQALARITRASALAVQLPPTGAGAAIDQLIADLLAPSPSARPASGEEIRSRLDLTEPRAVIAQIPCAGCGAPHPEDVPRCFACGHEMLRVGGSTGGPWRLVLNRLDEGLDATEKLLRLLSPLIEPVGRPVLFLTGRRQLYSAEELARGVDFPAVLFSDLQEEAAHTLAGVFGEHGFDVSVIRGAEVPRLKKKVQAPNGFQLAMMSVYLGWGVDMLARGAGASHNVVAGFATGLVSYPALRLGWRRWKQSRLKSAPGVFKLRDQLAPVPAADRLLAGATAAAGKLRAPEVRALFAEASTEVYRLARRAATAGSRTRRIDPSSEAALVARTLAAAPALLERLVGLAERLDGLDEALAERTDGELMAGLARLARAASAPGADRAALDATRRDVEAALERREAAEHDRARLAATLCALLGRLRQVAGSVRQLQTSSDADAATLEAARAEVDALLTPRSD